MVKRRKVKKGKVGLLLMLLLIIVGGILLYINKDKIFKKEVKEVQKAEKIEPKETTTSLSLAMVGDMLIHSSVYRDAKTTDGYDFKPMITKIKSKIKDYDLAYYNQETILGGTKLGLSDYPTFNSPQEVGDAMIDAGFNLVSLATNHTIDRGYNAVKSSRKYWNKQEGVLATGSYTSAEEKKQIETTILEKNDIKYTMLNYTYGTNGIPVPEGKEYEVNVWPTDLSINDPEKDTKYQNYKKTVKANIDAVRDKVDVLIVAMHWGVEYTHTPTNYEKDMANFLADNGVNIIIGTHPHVIQPVEWIDDTIVFYSLGNFISAQEANMDYMKMVELMGSLKITKTTKENESTIKISDIKTELLFNQYNTSSWSNFHVIPFSSSSISKYLPNYKTVYTKYKKVVQKYDKTIPVESCYE